MILVLDNYDSFTYNLAQYLQELQYRVFVCRNDEITISEISDLNPASIVISPGPGRPNDAGITLEAINFFAGKIPIFGVCLGLQSIAQAFDAKIISAREIKHGKTSLVYHRQQGAFQNLNSPLRATRYHSLVVERETLPNDFEITAYTKKADGSFDEIMGIKHKNLALEGVQFHPESILSEQGHELLNNFIKSNTPTLSSLALAAP